MFCCGNTNEEEIEYKTVLIGDSWKEVMKNFWVCKDQDDCGMRMFEIDKTQKTGKIKLGKVRTLESYVKCLRLVMYQLEHNKLPLQSIKINAKLNDKERFQGVEHDIKLYEQLKDVCTQIGISENYVFHEEEDLLYLFNGIIAIFREKRFELLNIHDHRKLENAMIYNIELSKYVKVKVMYVDNKFINFFSNEVLSQIGGFIPKVDIQNNDVNNDWKPNNWEKNYWKVSIYIVQSIKEMVETTNFNFEIFKLSFSKDYHDISSDVTINSSLE